MGEPMNELPIVRVQVDAMRTSMLQVLDDRHQDLVAVFNAGLDQAIVELPGKLAREIKAISEDIMQEAMRKALTEYWESGAGRSAIDQMIAKKFGNTRSKP